MRRKHLLLYIILIPLLFTGCDMVETVQDMIPDFSVDHPNMIFANWQELSELETEGGAPVIKSELILKEDGSYRYIKDDLSSEGRYGIVYDHLGIFECSGQIEFDRSFEGSGKFFRFIYKADREMGPSTLKLYNNCYQVLYEANGR